MSNLQNVPLSQDLDLGDLAKGFCLLRLPKMPEIKKGKGVEGFAPSSVDPDSGKGGGKGGRGGDGVGPLVLSREI